jgi:hypothetical protein
MRIETLPLAAAEQLCRALSQRKACQTLEMIAITSESEALRENSAKPFDSNNVSFTVCSCDVRASMLVPASILTTTYFGKPCSNSDTLIRRLELHITFHALLRFGGMPSAPSTSRFSYRWLPISIL